MQTGVHYYVWYQVTGDPQHARTAIDAMMTDLARRTGIAGRLFLRRGESSTWMENYEGVSDPALFEREFIAVALEHDLARFINAGGRHVEAFVAAG